MYKPKVAISPVNVREFVYCDQCPTVKEWTRERARQHSAQHGHTVRFVVERITVYRPLKDGA